MKAPTTSAWIARVIGATAALLALACDEPPADLREWTPSDHRGETQNPERMRQSTGQPSTSEPGLDDVTLATWSKSCTVCHGRIGRGDGPQGAMLKTRDLTDARWQASVTDEQIAATIRQGRGSMPAFPLPDNTIKSLVQLIRRLVAAAPAAAAPPPAAGSAAPAGSANPAAAGAGTVGHGGNAGSKPAAVSGGSAGKP